MEIILKFNHLNRLTRKGEKRTVIYFVCYSQQSDCLSKNTLSYNNNNKSLQIQEKQAEEEEDDEETRRVRTFKCMNFIFSSQKFNVNSLWIVHICILVCVHWLNWTQKEFDCWLRRKFIQNTKWQAFNYAHSLIIFKGKKCVQGVIM